MANSLEQQIRELESLAAKFHEIYQCVERVILEATPADAQKALAERERAARLDELKDTVMALWSDELNLEQKKAWIKGRIAELSRLPAEQKDRDALSKL